MCITSISICLWLISAFCLLFSPPALEMRKCTLWYLQMCTCINICDICRCASVWIPVHPCASASMPPCCYERLGGPLGVQLPQTEGFPQPHHQFNEQRCFLVLLCSLKYIKIYYWVNFVYCHDLASVFFAFCKSCQQNNVQDDVGINKHHNHAQYYLLKTRVLWMIGWSKWEGGCKACVVFLFTGNGLSLPQSIIRRLGPNFPTAPLPYQPSFYRLHVLIAFIAAAEIQ